MNYLALCQRAVTEAGITGNGPTNVESQTGQLLKITGWVNQAWQDIQLMRPNWLFMNEEFSFNTATATRDYLAADQSINDMKLWDTGSFLIFDPAVGVTEQGELVYYPYQKWRRMYRNQMEARTDDKPQLFTILPNNKIRFEPQPDKVYTIDGEYKRSTQEFTANEDVPTGLPEDFHILIVWKALQYYASYEDAPEVMDEAETSFDNLLLRLENEQLMEFSEDFEALA